MTKKAIDIILWEQGFYPFSIKYNLEKAIEKHQETLKNCELDITTNSILNHSGYFNSYFKDIGKALSKVISKSQLSKDQITELIIADLNRTELIIGAEQIKALKAGDTFDNNSIANTYVSKPEFQNQRESVWGLIDGAVDTADINLNYLKHIKFEAGTTISNELNQVDVIKNLGILGSTFNAIKHAYDRIIWRGYSIESNDLEVKLKPDVNHLMLENAALTRLTTNISNVSEELNLFREKYTDIVKLFLKTRRFQQISSVEIKDDKLKILYKARERKPGLTFNNLMAPLLTYYPFYKSSELSELGNLTLLDLINLFASLHDLVEKLPKPAYENTDVMNLDKFLLFNPKIEKNLLIEYFTCTTKYSKKQILIFIDLITQKGDEHNLYLFPVYELDNSYCFANSTVFRANILYLVDKWLTIAKSDLSERGHAFENYISNFLKHEKLNEFAKFKMFEQKSFSIINNDGSKSEEEIDLLIKTDTSLIIAEIKCITYPFESDDNYKSMQIIKKAKDQVVRKEKFLTDNWIHFKSLFGERENITTKKIIIVNFPQFSGRAIEGIPITDFYMFLSYFKSGQLTKVKLERGKQPVYDNILYYNSKQSFSENFARFFLDPVPIKDVVSRQEIEEYEVTAKGTEPKTTSLRVIYKPRSI